MNEASTLTLASGFTVIPDSDSAQKITISPPVLQQTDSSGVIKAPEQSANQQQEILPAEPSSDSLKRSDSIVASDVTGPGAKSKGKQIKKVVKGPRLLLGRVVGDMAYCVLQAKNQEIDFEFSMAEDNVEDIATSMVSFYISR
jgi:hypothetical protein